LRRCKPTIPTNSSFQKPGARAPCGCLQASTYCGGQPLEQLSLLDKARHTWRKEAAQQRKQFEQRQGANCFALIKGRIARVGGPKIGSRVVEADAAPRPLERWLRRRSTLRPGADRNAKHRDCSETEPPSTRWVAALEGKSRGHYGGGRGANPRSPSASRR